MLTKVLNTNTGKSFYYSLPPEKAVVAAFEQFSKGNFDTWTYPTPGNHLLYARTKFGHICGEFWAKSLTI